MSTPPNRIPPPLDDIEDLLALYFDNQTTPEVCDAIEQWLRQDPSHPRIFAEYGYIERLIYTAQKSEDASAIFALLAKMEDAAEPELVELDAEALAPRRPKPAEQAPLTAREVVSITGYLIGRASRSKPALVGYAAAAAMLAAVLLIPWGGEPSPQTAPQTRPSTPSQARPVAVATLTADHDAQWAAFKLSAGDTLYAKQRLTLTHGFAEITTARGAVALLEAPATIELTDNDNALRLHTGKLVGICETAASKGFLVRTPHLDVTDIGTRFEVAFSEGQGTSVDVQTGVVSVSPAGAHSDYTERLVKENQFVRVSHDGQSSAFYERVGKKIDLQPIATGRGFEPGQIDAAWALVDGDEKQPLYVMQHRGNVWLKGEPTTSQWLSLSADEKPNRPRDVFHFVTSLTIPEGVDPETATINVRYLADDALEAVWVNGKRVASNLPLPRPDLDEIDHKQYQTWSTLELTEGFQAGQNEIRFAVRNKKHTVCFRAELTGSAMQNYRTLEEK